MKILLLAPLLLLAGCAQDPQQPLDDTQRAMVLQMLMSRQPMQAPQVQFHPLQAPPPPQRQWNCTTVPIGGGQTSTTCQ